MLSVIRYWCQGISYRVLRMNEDVALWEYGIVIRPITGYVINSDFKFRSWKDVMS